MQVLISEKNPPETPSGDQGRQLQNPFIPSALTAQPLLAEIIEECWFIFNRQRDREPCSIRLCRLLQMLEDWKKIGPPPPRPACQALPRFPALPDWKKMAANDRDEPDSILH